MKNQKYLIFIILTIFLASCGNSSWQGQKKNQVIEFMLLPFSNPQDRPIPLIIINNSEETVFIPDNTPEMYLVNSIGRLGDQIYHSVRNSVTTEIILEPYDEMAVGVDMSYYPLHIWPFVPEDDLPTEIAVIMEGYIVRDGYVSDDKVIAELRFVLE